MIKRIPFNIPHYSKDIKKNLDKVLKNNKLTDGKIRDYTERYIEKTIESKKIFLTQSCTNALEASISICGLKKNDEIILPSYTFTSTANCILLNSAKPIFADIDPKTLNLDSIDVRKKITKKTKAIILVHYNGLSCHFEEFLKIKKKYNLFLIEDCAHAFTAKYKNKFLGTIGDLGAFSFHDTKNFPVGQGGALSVNNKNLIKRAKIYCDKGTDRSFMGNKSYYSWKGVGSEIRATELTSSIIYSQIKSKKNIQNKRKKIWQHYHSSLKKIKQNIFYLLDEKYNQSKCAYHIFPIIFKNRLLRFKFTKFMKSKGVECFFHYYPLHLSSYGKSFCKYKLQNTKFVYNGLVRLPIYPNLTNKNLKKILKEISNFLSLTV